MTIAQIYRRLFALIFLLLTGCDFSGTLRPTLTGQVVDSQWNDGIRPVGGVVVAVQAGHVVIDDRELSEARPLQVGRDYFLYQEFIESTVSEFDGKFSLPGRRLGPGVMSSLPPDVYRVRFHRDGYRDAVYDFFYPFTKPSLYIAEKDLGRIPLQPSPEACATRPATQFDVIARPQLNK